MGVYIDSCKENQDKKEDGTLAGETVITVIGNLTADPELRWTGNGAAVASFTVASTPRTYDRNSGEWKDGESLFMRCSVWRNAAENVAESLRKGMRVIAQGRLVQRSYETKEGERRTVVELQVDEIGPSLRSARAQVTRTSNGGGFSQGRGSYQSGGQRPAHGAGEQMRQGAYNGGGAQQGGFQQQAPAVQADAFAGGGAATQFGDEPPF